MIDRAPREPIGSRDQEPWQAAQAARVAATVAAVASDPDPNAVGRALGYDMGGGGLVGLAGTVMTATVDMVRSPVFGAVMPVAFLANSKEGLAIGAQLPVVGSLVKAGLAAGAVASALTRPGAPTALDLAGAATAARAALSSQADVARNPRPGPRSLDMSNARAQVGTSGAATLRARLAAMDPRRAQAAIVLLLLLQQQRRA